MKKCLLLIAALFCFKSSLIAQVDTANLVITDVVIENDGIFPLSNAGLKNIGFSLFQEKQGVIINPDEVNLKIKLPYFLNWKQESYLSYINPKWQVLWQDTALLLLKNIDTLNYSDTFDFSFNFDVSLINFDTGFITIAAYFDNDSEYYQEGGNLNFIEKQVYSYMDIPLYLGVENFLVYSKDCQVEISWEVISNKNNYNFIIERSKDGKNYIKIAELYNETYYTDYPKENGTYYYRLLENIYHAVKKVDFYCDNDEVVIYPNPSRHFVNISSFKAIKTIKVYNSLGTPIEAKYGHLNSKETLSLYNYQKGFYIIEIITENDKVFRKKIMKTDF